MANVTETSNFDAGIYQLETTDPLEGGALGVLNYAIKGLANRTRWLYNKVVKFTPTNRGWFSGLDIGSSTGSLSRSGDISAAVASVPFGNNSAVLITFSNSMTNTNYYLEIFLESLGAFSSDNDLFAPVYQKVSATQAIIYFQETGDATQNLKVHVKVISLY